MNSSNNNNFNEKSGSEDPNKKNRNTSMQSDEEFNQTLLNIKKSLENMTISLAESYFTHFVHSEPSKEEFVDFGLVTNIADVANPEETLKVKVHRSKAYNDTQFQIYDANTKNPVAYLVVSKPSNNSQPLVIKDFFALPGTYINSDLALMEVLLHKASEFGNIQNITIPQDAVPLFQNFGYTISYTINYGTDQNVCNTATMSISNEDLAALELRFLPSVNFENEKVKRIKT